MFIPIKESKKLIDKLKRLCNAITKFNLNSPCLLQIIRVDGEYHFIITHDPTNEDKCDYYKVFNTVLNDDFVIREEDDKLFNIADERVSIPIIVSSFGFNKLDDLDKTTENRKRLLHMKYDCAINSYYIFPKFVNEAIKENIIEGFEVDYEHSEDILFQRTFEFKIVTKKNKRFNNILFINNINVLNNIFQLNILPFHENFPLSSLIHNLYHSPNMVSFLSFSKERWEEIFDENEYSNSIIIPGFDNHPFILYHHDFIQKKIVKGFISKHYEGNIKDIVSLYLSIELNNNIHQYFKYRYYEL
jgi:hypothetical protein